MSIPPRTDPRPAEAASRRSPIPLPAGTLAGLLLAAIAAILIAWVSSQSSQERASTVRQFTRTLEIVDRLQGLSATLTDAETGQRGFIITGEEPYLEPYVAARGRFDAQLANLRELVAGDGPQSQRVEQMAAVARDKFGELEQTIAARRAGGIEPAQAVVRTNRGKQTMDRFRGLVAEMDRVERARVESARESWEGLAGLQGYVTWGGAALLLVLIVAAGAISSRDYKQRERTSWIRTGESQLASRIAGEQSFQHLGHEVLDFLAQYLGAKVGAAYARHDDGRYHRVAGYALDAVTASDAVRPGESLVGQAAKEGRAIRVSDLPEGYLPLASGIGRGAPRELLVTPAAVDGEVQGVVEVGLVRRVDDADLELLDRVAATLAIALRSARERERREELLEETQQLAEELQTQQEELRVSNEELEEQGRVLRESQTRLESQHAELEQTNVQLEEQAQRLERQKRELVRAQDALAENARTLERSSRYKTEFLANMSHELRTPLNSSLILAKLLADNGKGNLDEEQVRFARTIHSSNNDLLTLINDILDLSKIESGQVEIVPEPTPLDDILQPLRATFEPIAADRKLALNIERAPNAPAQLTTDRQRLQQVLRNLLSNAFKFTAKGEVTLQVTAVGQDRVAFAVRDTGIGIPEAQHEVIFEAFRQADGTTSRQFGGTGLGLSISRELARLLGGAIRLQSAPGMGSTFTLEIPCVIAARTAARPEPRAAAEFAAPPNAATDVPRSSPAPALRTERANVVERPHVDDDRAQRKRPDRLILVIEDDLAFAAILRDLAHELDFDCVHCASAGEGLEMARRLAPSGVLLDVSLPDESGLSVLDRIKRDPAIRHIPVHMVSVDDHSQAALGMGAVGYALKPVARDDLVKAIGRLEARLQKRVSRVLVVEDDPLLRQNIARLLQGESVEITAVGTVAEALQQVEQSSFDCLVTDLALPDASGYDLLEKLAEGGRHPLLPVIVYTGRALSREEETRLARYAKSIILKGARSPERLLDEVTLFLHRVESQLPPDQQNILRRARQRDEVFEGRQILLAEDDVRNIFALSRVLEPLGAHLEIARNGQEAVDRVAKGGIDLVLMDIMMPVKDGLQATREIRAERQHAKLPIIAITAKAMADDRRQCLDAGANDYIAKPIDVDQLVSLCRVWLSK